MKKSVVLHKIALYASTLCVIHCIVFPIAIAVLPFFQLAFYINFWVEALIVTITAVIGAITTWHGFKKHHGRLFPLILFTLGVFLMIASHAVHTHDMSYLIYFVEVFGGLCIATSQIINLKLTNRRDCNDCH